MRRVRRPAHRCPAVDTHQKKNSFQLTIITRHPRPLPFVWCPCFLRPPLLIFAGGHIHISSRENTLYARRANCIGSVGLQLLANAMAEPLRFLELPSAPDVSFWARLAELKLNEYKLSEDPIPCVGHYRACAHEGLASPLTLTSASFELDTTYEVRSIAKNLIPPRDSQDLLTRRSLTLFWLFPVDAGVCVHHVLCWRAEPDQDGGRGRAAEHSGEHEDL